MSLVGFLIVIGLGCEGLDIMLLQEKSNVVFPPHINFLSIKGFDALFSQFFSGVDIMSETLEVEPA